MNNIDGSINWNKFKKEYETKKDIEDKRTLLLQALSIVTYSKILGEYKVIPNISKLFKEMQSYDLDELVNQIMMNDKMKTILNELLRIDKQLFDVIDKEYKNDVTPEVQKFLGNLLKLQLNSILRLLRQKSSNEIESPKVQHFTNDLINILGKKIETVNKLQEKDLMDRYSAPVSQNKQLDKNTMKILPPQNKPLEIFPTKILVPSKKSSEIVPIKNSPSEKIPIKMLPYQNKPIDVFPTKILQPPIKPFETNSPKLLLRPKKDTKQKSEHSELETDIESKKSNEKKLNHIDKNKYINWGTNLNEQIHKRIKDIEDTIFKAKPNNISIENYIDDIIKGKYQKMFIYVKNNITGKNDNQSAKEYMIDTLKLINNRNINNTQNELFKKNYKKNNEKSSFWTIYDYLNNSNVHGNFKGGKKYKLKY